MDNKDDGEYRFWENEDMDASIIRMEITAAAAYAAMASVALAAPGRTKFIANAWEFGPAWPKDFVAAADEFDKTAIDGVGIFLKGYTPDGKLIGMRDIFSADWTYEAFAPLIPDMREMTKHKAFRESFCASFRSPLKYTGRIAWEDDETWARVARNMRVAARIAREGGFRGLQMDVEDYNHVRQFVRQPDEKPFKELSPLVRRRAAEVFGAAFEEYPDMVLLSFWMLSSTPSWYDVNDLAGFVRDKGDLWPSFVNGILDVLPPTAKIVDGDENGYRYEAQKNMFYNRAVRTRRGLTPLVAPENREKYEKQMLVSFGQYFDMYTHPTNSSWAFPPLDGSRLERFRVNLTQAVELADEYIWLWGERFHLVNWADGYTENPSLYKGTWEERLPGVTAMMKFVKDPQAFARERMAELSAQGRLVNLVSNGVDEAGADTGVPKFGTWRAGDDKGVGSFGIDPKGGENGGPSLCATGCLSGCYVITLKGVKHGEYYAIQISSLGEGASAGVSWRNAENKYVGRAVKMSFEGDDMGKWRQCLLPVYIPAGAASMTLTLDASIGDGVKVWFDNVGIYKLHDAPGPEPDPDDFEPVAKDGK